jgi:hypothetical protein
LEGGTVLTESIKQKADIVDCHRQGFAPAGMGVTHHRLLSAMAAAIALNEMSLPSPIRWFPEAGTTFSESG